MVIIIRLQDIQLHWLQWTWGKSKCQMRHWEFSGKKQKLWIHGAVVFLWISIKYSSALWNLKYHTLKSFANREQLYNWIDWCSKFWMYCILQWWGMDMFHRIKPSLTVTDRHFVEMRMKTNRGGEAEKKLSLMISHDSISHTCTDKHTDKI